MKATEPLPLHHSWPMAEAGRRFDLELVQPDASSPPPTIDPDRNARAWPAGHDTGVSECDLKGVTTLRGLKQDISREYH